jgi:hypothetical protein
MAAYHQICAYSCFRIHPVTGAQSADHFAPKSQSWRKVYQWSNYRLCSGRLNARKNDYGDVLDPFEIQPGWFQLELLGFQVIPDPTSRPRGPRTQIDTWRAACRFRSSRRSPRSSPKSCAVKDA